MRVRQTEMGDGEGGKRVMRIEGSVSDSSG